MKEITPPVSKLLAPIQVDVRANNNNKSLSDLRQLLQTGSLLKGVINEVSKTGDVIFTTIHGKFALANTQEGKELLKGDKLVVRIEFDDNQISAKLISLNSVSIKTANIVPLKIIKLINPTQTKSKQDSSTDLSNIKQANQLPTLKAEINYLNLSKINNNSVIYKALVQADNTTTIDLKIVTDATPKLSLPYRINGEVISSESGKQLIKTAFGILSVNNIELPLGKKVVFEIKSIGNVKMDNVSIKSNVEDLLFKINNNFSLLKNLSNLVKGDDSKLTASSSNMYSANINAKQLEGQITFSQIKNDLIDKLTSNDNKSSIRELLQDNNHLKNIMNITDSKNLNDLIYRINNNQISNLSLISIMKNDKEREIFKKNANRSSFENGSSDKSSPSLDDDQPNNIISKFLSSFKQKEAINKLSEDFTKLKESFNINIHEDQKDKWFNFNIPIYNEEKVQDQLISINKQSNGYIRFVIDLNLEAMGEIQLDGLIKLNAKTRNVENFDLALRFKNQLKGEIQSEIFDLFVLNQNLANLRGGLTFEQVAEFPVRSFTSDAEDRDGLSLLLQELKSQN